MTSDTSLLAPVIVAAALLIRTALVELRQPGSARAQWAFATDRRAAAAGVVVAVGVLLLGLHRIGPAAGAWALLIGALTAHLVHQGGHRP